MPEHRVFLQLDSVAVGDRVVIRGDEAQHAARVKRCAVGDTVGLLDGRGRTARARIESIRKDPGTKAWEIEVLTQHITRHARPSPRLEVWSAVPKGGRLEDLVDQLSQVGACAWAPLQSARSVVEPTEHKAARLDRVVRESAKQCGRAWLLEVCAGGDLSDALRAGSVVFADAPGPRTAIETRGAGADAGTVRVLVGPEGGWTDDERRAASEAGAVPASFGPHVMRIETAAVAAAAIVLERLARDRVPAHERESR